ncbi:MAG: hypothetical protein WCP39_00765 [Chlamydiota bacterium]
MDQKELIQKIAQLESFNDQLLAELQSIDTLARQLGFTDGLTTLKSAAEELIKIQDEENPPMTGS